MAAAFETAKASLEAARQGPAAMLKIASLSAMHSGDRIDARHVKLSSSWKTIEAGELFVAEIDMSALSIQVSGKFDFDVGEPASPAQDLLTDAPNEAKNPVA